jgi:hypothetical protein
VKLGIGRRYALVLFAWALSCVLACIAGCPAAKAPAGADLAQARIEQIAEGVRIADATCSAAAKGLADAGKRDLGYTVASTCARGYSVARGALLTAQAWIPLYGDATSGAWACAAGDAVAGLREMARGLTLGGIPVPAKVADVLVSVQVQCVPPSSVDAGADARAGALPDATIAVFDILPEGG